MIGTASLQRGRVLEDDLADARMLDDGPPLGRGERGRLVEDLLGDGDLADVVEQRRDRGSGRPRRPAARAGGPSSTTIDAISADGWPR